MARLYKYMISFDGENWQEVSKFVNSKETSLKRAFLSSDYKSSTNVLEFNLITKPRINSEEHATLLINMLDAIVAGQSVYIAFYESDSIQFKGVLDDRGVSQKISSHPESISITAYDFTYLLDEDVQGYFEFPSDFTVDTDGWYVFKNNPLDTENDLIVELITMAGFSIDDIDFENSTPVMKYDEPTVFRHCRHIADDEDSERTYRDIIDTLLHENCKVLTTGNDGKFIITDMYPSVEIKDLSRNYFTKSDAFNIKMSMRDYDGIKLKWSELDVMEARIYDGNLGGKIGESAEFEGGLQMNGGSYYPETSDIEEVRQEYSSSWLDRPYYTKVSRLKNEDLSLLSAKNIFYEAFKDDEIVLDTGYPYTYSLSAIFRFKNTSDDVKEFHAFYVYGDCLYRNKINDYTYPTDCMNAETYESEFIYEQEQANQYCHVLAKLKNYGIMQYTWSQTLEIKEGELWHISPRDTKIDTDVIITSVTIKYFGGQRYYSVTAQGFGEYTSDEIRKRSSTVGASTGNYGKDGTNGSNAVLEYAKNNSLDTPPDPDTLFMFGDRQMLFMGREMGFQNWYRTAPSSTELADNEYIWQRGGND